MKNKVTLAVSAALMSMSMHSAAELSEASKGFSVDNTLRGVSDPVSINKNQHNVKKSVRFIKEKGLEEKEYIYIVHLENDSVAMYDGDIQGLEATNPHTKAKLFSAKGPLTNASIKLDVNAPATRAYASYLDTQQDAFIQKAQKIVAFNEPVARYKYGLNGLAIKATPTEAEALSKLSGVKYVERDAIYTLDTHTGPVLVGAPAVWDGSAQGSEVGNQGEGVVIGIIDSGVNTDHPSFADIGGDGYDHTNPLGEGVYLGDCAGDHAALCNDKLIGVYSYPVITDNYADTTVFPEDLPRNGEDYGGHGSHVASTAGGNVLLDVEESFPEAGVEESDGIGSGFVYDRMSGVAPHANIVSYQVCFGGRSAAGDTYGDCPGAAIAAGIESAITDGVDVINYSISGGGFPWNSSTEMAYLAARNAGIFVATSAGNGGPGAATTPKHAPWYTAVAASEHGTAVVYEKEIRDFTGGDTELDTITGNNNSGGITASIVYAGDFTNANDPDGDPAQCLQPFPEGTFSGEIVVCDRGSIARVAKAENAAAGGAGGVVLANIDGGATSIANDIFVIPGIHIDATQGNALKAWLASGEGHSATITESDGVLEQDDSRVDVLANFSSKGPNSSISTLTPTMTGPGVNIYAAYSDQHFGHDGTGPAPGDYAYLSGTSMSSPHIAGAAALVRSVHPTWNPDQIRSALAMTAEAVIIKEDGTTAGDWFDMGSGRIRVDYAVQTGLVMDETADNYENANPNEGGEPRSLNLPSVTDNNCVGTCSWTRTLTATQDGSWTIDTTAISPGLEITVTPATFDIVAGATQDITVEIDAFSAESDVWSFGDISLTSDSSPDLHIPVSVIASNGNLPDEFVFDANRNFDSFLVTDLMAVEITDFQSAAYGLVKAQQMMGEVAQDSDNSDFLDNLEDGLNISTVDIAEGTLRFAAMITESTSPDLDLWVLFDANADGIPTEDEIVAFSATGTSLESVDFAPPGAGLYWVIVQNWAASDAGTDTFNLAWGAVTPEDAGNMSVEAPSAIEQLTPFDLRVAWQLDDAVEGDIFIGMVSMGTDADNATNLGMVPVTIFRGEDDVQVTSDSLDRLEPGQQLEFNVEVAANFTAEDRDYEISLTLPEGVSLVDGSLGDNATVEGSTITWLQTQTSLLGVQPTYRATSNATDPLCANPNFGQGGGYLDLAAFDIGFTSLDGDSVAGTFDVPGTFLGEVVQGITVTDDGFVTFGNTTGSTPWVNQLMPNSEEPNSVVAPFWRDMEFDVANGSGFSLATAGAAVTILEWDNMRYWNLSDDYADILDFQVVFMNQASLDEPHIIFSYDNVTHQLGDQLPVSVGFDNADGTEGLTTHYSDGDVSSGNINDGIVSGAQVCLYLVPVSDEPTRLPFTVEVAQANTGGPIQMMAMSSVTSSTYTAAVASEVFADVQVEGAPQPTIGGDVAAQMSVVELRELPLPGAVVEPNGDTYDITWKQVSGPAAVIAGNGIAEAMLIAPEVTEDTVIELEMTVTDVNGLSATATATVTVLNNMAPTLTVAAPTTIGESETIVVSATATDPEGDALSFTINGIAGSTLSETAPGTSSEVIVTYTVTVSDGLNETTEVVSVTVTDKSAGSIGWIALLLLPIVYMRRRAK